ncbi:hypothetical protein L873DRAFT_1389435 [Choiromyces venosus 120613-1]|uniref:Uncharacterized protein n=1 Tax=Choiromyces venosus 120613-1 TaxID=1336337 RepID=A0A3N4J9H9_9PEZI|nr:hypothetical protein L873DRAFT_1389435 [Choiromyces venosus 120613-1]
MYDLCIIFVAIDDVLNVRHSPSNTCDNIVPVHGNAHHNKIPKLFFIHISQSHSPNTQQIQRLPVGWILWRFRMVEVEANK